MKEKIFFGFFRLQNFGTSWKAKFNSRFHFYCHSDTGYLTGKGAG
jgi:hypothetical protein